MRVYFEAFGCTLNKGESYLMAQKARDEGFELSGSPEESDCTVISTCTVVETTERRMLRRISELSDSGKPVIVSGCMAGIQRDRVLSIAPHALFLTIDEVGRIGEILGSLHSPAGAVSPVRPRTRGVDVAIPISQGCLGQCTYCITRVARGLLRSRPLEDIKEDVRRAIDSGFKEIRLCAQDTAAFGTDSATTLYELIGALAQIPGEYMIRVGMMNPLTSVGRREIVGVFDFPNVYKFLHLPVQSGSQSILELMGRGYTPESFEKLVMDFRRAHSDITLSTDIIVGFPGETDSDFQASCDLIRNVKPDLLNITRFSAREGTPASQIDHRVPGWKAKERSRVLTKLRSDIGLARNERLVGSTQDVLLTEVVKEGTTVGRSLNYKPVVFRERIPLGTFVKSRIVGAGDAYLWGELL